MDAPIEAGCLVKRRPSVDSVSSNLLTKRIAHAASSAKRAAGRTDDFLAVERDFAVVVRHYDETVRIVASQPVLQLFSMQRTSNE